MKKITITDADALELFDRQKQILKKTTEQKKRIREYLGEAKGRIYLDAVKKILNCEADVTEVLALAALVREIQNKKMEEKQND